MAAAVANPADFDGSMLKCKKAVFKHRVKDFIMDFDKLRSGFVHDNHFLTALSMAKLDKELSPAESRLVAIAEHYRWSAAPASAWWTTRPSSGRWTSSSERRWHLGVGRGYNGFCEQLDGCK
jgi:hypothetical protein